MDLDEVALAFRKLVDIIKALRTPVTGCPWDLEQTHATLRPFLVEEAYEVLDAMDSGDDPAFREELGDLLLQVVLHAQIADDRGAFSITEVVDDIAAKMVRRHPHVFGGERVTGAAEVLRNWDQIKAAEAAAKPGAAPRTAALGHLPQGLPALLAAQRLGEQAAKAGLDSPSLAAALRQVREGLANLENDIGPQGDTHLQSGAIPPDEPRARLEGRLGDLLFSVCQLARRAALSAEDSLRAANKRFLDQFTPTAPAQSHSR